MDSRGNPTVEVEAVLSSGSFGRAIVPSGAIDRSIRSGRTPRRRRPLRRQGSPASGRQRQHGDRRGGPRDRCLRPASAGQLLLRDVDGTPNKASLGANATLGVSLAVARAAADDLLLPLYRYVGGVNAHVLPVPMMNVLNGGEHADNNVDFQEFMIMPVGAASFSEALRWGIETYHALAKVLHESRPEHRHRRRRWFRSEPGQQRRRPEAPPRGDRGRRSGSGHRHRPGDRRGVDRVLRRRQLRSRR